MTNNTSITLLEFAWDNLTDNQRYAITMKYELKKAIDKLEEGATKRSVYRLIAERFPGYSMDRIEWIYKNKLNKK